MFRNRLKSIYLSLVTASSLLSRFLNWRSKWGISSWSSSCLWLIWSPYSSQTRLCTSDPMRLLTRSAILRRSVSRRTSPMMSRPALRTSPILSNWKSMSPYRRGKRISLNGLLFINLFLFCKWSRTWRKPRRCKMTPGPHQLPLLWWHYPGRCSYPWPPPSWCLTAARSWRAPLTCCTDLNMAFHSQSCSSKDSFITDQKEGGFPR